MTYYKQVIGVSVDSESSQDVFDIRTFEAIWEMLTKFDNGYIRQHFVEDFYMTFSTKKPHKQIIIMKHTDN